MIRQPAVSPHRLRLARETAGMCRAAAARNLHCTYTCIYLYEAGKRTPPAATLAQMALLYDVRIGDLFRWPEEKP